MKIKFACLLAGLTLALPSIAWAQSSDAAYCTVLSQQYTKLVSDSDAGKNHNNPSADIASAQSKCDSDPKQSIPILEKALTDKRINLPPRT